MKKLFILSFVFAVIVSTIFMTGCNPQEKTAAIHAIAVKLVPMGEKAATKYMAKLIEDGKITEYQRDKIIKLYLKLKNKHKPKGSAMKNTVTPEQVENCIIEKEVKTVDLVGKKHTLVAVKLRNGFTCIETTTCVDPENYSEDIGAQVCMERIKNKIWLLEGYLLQDNLSNRA